MKRLLPLLVFALAGQAVAGNYIGEYAPGDTVDCNFATYRPSTGATFTLGGTPAISAYKDNSTTQSTAGITLSADFDSVTGLNHVRVTTGTDGTFYSAGSFFSLVITTGTVDSVSVTGSEVCSFSLNKEAGLRPTTPARTLTVDASGNGNSNLVNIAGSAVSSSSAQLGVNVVNAGGTAWGSGAITAGSIANGAIDEATFATDTNPRFGVLTSGTAQAGSTGTTLVLAGSTDFTANDRIQGATCAITGGTGAGEALTVASYVNSTDTATMSGTWPTTPDNTSAYMCYRTAPSSGGSGLDAAGVRSAIGLASANLDTQLSGIQSDTDNLQTRLPTSLVSGRIDASVGAYQTGLTPLQPTTAGRTLDVTATGEAGIDWANIGGATTTVNLSGTTFSTSQGVASVSGAVGSVSGNVGGTVNGLTATAQGNVRTAVGLASANLDTQLDTLPTAAENADAIWDEAQSGHTTAGTFGLYLDSAISGVSGGGGPTAATIADAVWDEARTGHTTSGTFGFYVDSAISGVSTGGVSAGEIADAVWDEATSGHTTAGTTGERLTRIPNAAAGGNGGLATVDASNRIAGIQGTVNNLNNLDATVSSRASSSSLSTESSTIQAAITALNNLSSADVTTVLQNLVIEPNGNIKLPCALAEVLAYTGGDITTSGSNSTYKDHTGTDTRMTITVSSPGNRASTITCPGP